MYDMVPLEAVSNFAKQRNFETEVAKEVALLRDAIASSGGNNEEMVVELDSKSTRLRRKESAWFVSREAWSKRGPFWWL